MYNIKKMNFLKTTLITIFIFAFIGGCQNAGNNSPSTVPTPSQRSQITPITIDDTGLVPLVNNNPTTSIVYIHNNTDHQISGITYIATHSQDSSLTKITPIYKSLLNKVFGISDANSFISSDSNDFCATIPAYSSCPLSFTTSALFNYQTQDSTLITANYTDNNKPGSFSQLINYADVSSDDKDGVQVMSGGEVNGFGNSTGYATIYAYGTGINQNFKVTGLSMSKPNTAITNGNIIGTTVQSGFVQAIEVSAVINNTQAYSTSLNLQSTNQDGSGQFNSQSNLYVPNLANTPQLLIGLVPVIDTFANPIGPFAINIINTSSNTITGLQATGSGGITFNVSACQVIESYHSCTISYSLPQYPGNSIISVSGTSAGSIVTSPSQSVIWFNSKQGALLSALITPNPLSFTGATAGGNTAIVNLGNVAGFNIESLNVTSMKTVVGMATVSLLSLGNCASGNIPVNGNCAYIVKVTDEQAESGVIYLTINGKYRTNESTLVDYSRVIPLNYISLPNLPVVTASQNITTMQINGNNIESMSQIITISNNGALPVYTGTPYINKVSGDTTGISILNPENCTKKTLTPPNMFCTMTVKLGPLNNNNTAPINSTVNVALTYSGGTAKILNVTTNNFNTTIYANGQSLAISNIVAMNSASGSGTSAQPYIFTGQEVRTKTIAVTYQNMGSNPVRINNIDLSINPAQWSIASDTCTNTTLTAKTGTCILTFNDDLARNFQALLGGLGSVYDMSLNLPGISFTDTILNTQFYTTPSYNNAVAVSVRSTQATVVNIESVSNGMVTLTHSLANALGYPVNSITIQSSMESYFTGFSLPPSNECSAPTTTGGVLTELCSFTNYLAQGTETLNVSYTLDKPYASNMILHTIFQPKPPTGMLFDMTPQLNALQLPLDTYSRVYVVDQILGRNNQIVMCRVGESTGQFSACVTGLTDPTNGIDSQILGMAVTSQFGVLYTSDNNIRMYPIDNSYKLKIESVTKYPSTQIQTLKDLKANTINNVTNIYFIGTLTLPAVKDGIINCAVNSTTAKLGTCIVTPVDNIVVSGGAQVTSLQSIYFANSKAYLAYNNNYIATCTINSNGAINTCFSNVAATTSFPIKSIVVNQANVAAQSNMVIVGTGTNQESSCIILSGNISSTCQAIQTIPSLISTPNGVEAYGSTFYYSGAESATNRNVYQCFLSTNPSAFYCQAAAPNRATIFSVPAFMAFVYGS